MVLVPHQAGSLRSLPLCILCFPFLRLLWTLRLTWQIHLCLLLVKAIMSMRISSLQWNLLSLPIGCTRENGLLMRVYSEKGNGLWASRVTSLSLARALWQTRGMLVAKRNFSVLTRVPIQKVGLADVADRCGHLPLRLRLLIQWLNECLNKADWKDLRWHGQGLPSFCDIMVYFHWVNSELCFSFSFSFSFLLLSYPFLSPLDSSWEPQMSHLFRFMRLLIMPRPGRESFNPFKQDWRRMRAISGN